jgi:hypothetical protein
MHRDEPRNLHRAWTSGYEKLLAVAKATRVHRRAAIAKFSGGSFVTISPVTWRSENGSWQAAETRPSARVGGRAPGVAARNLAVGRKQSFLPTKP